MKATLRGASVLATCLVAGFLSAHSQSEETSHRSWDPKAAAAYLDQRAAWWMTWDRAERDHGTFCVSCHTAMPYALSRGTLRGALAEHAPSVNERRLLENVTKRVRLWNEIGPYYSDEKHGVHKTAESRGTESVLNALILANDDAPKGRLSDVTRTAFNNMWALQEKAGEQKGAWRWLQFDLRPWEVMESHYFGAALAALAVGTAPESYRSTPEIHENLELLRGYLDREYARQSSLNRVVLLWASVRWPELLDAEQRNSIIDEVVRQQQADGGWSLSPLARTWKGSSLRSYVRSWIRKDGTLVERKSDGYATGLVVFVLQLAGIPPDSVELKRGLSWLMRSQSETHGLWPAYSLNKRRDPSSNRGRFMSDAATAHAVLALTQASAY